MRAGACDELWRVTASRIGVVNGVPLRSSYAELAPGFQTEAEANLRRVATSDDASARELVALAELGLNRREFASAIELYRRAHRSLLVLG
jgi:hypothetical protein